MKAGKTALKIGCIFVVLGLSLGTIWDFSMQLRRALTQKTFQTLTEVSQDYNRAFLDRISYHIRTMKVLAGSLERAQGFNKEDVVRILQNAVDDGGFIRMAVCGKDGISYSNDGQTADVSGRSYFKKAMAGATEISQPLTSLVSGEESIIIAVPLYDGNGTAGVLLGGYPLATAGEQLLDFSYYSEGYGFIVAPDGTILLSGEHRDKLTDEKNLFDFLNKAELVDFSVADIRTAIENGESKSFTFRYNGERRFVSFTPTTVNDWYTFSLSSDAVMLQQEQMTGEIVLRLILGLAVVSALVYAWIVLRNHRHNREMVAANQQYQSLIAHINGGMIVAIHAETAEETLATYVSTGFTDMTGYTLEDIQTLYGGRYLDVLYEADRGGAFAKYLEQLKESNTYRMPYRIRKKDGSLLWVMDNGYLVQDADGLHNHSILTNISALKEQEEALRLSENRFSVAVNASSGALFEVDLKNKRYTHFENAQRIFGVDSQRLLSDTRAFSELPYEAFMEAVTCYFFHPDDRSLAREAVAEAQKNGTVSFEARLQRVDDSYIWSRIDLSFSLDELGAPLRLVGFMSDIDAIKKQAELLKSKIQTDSMTGLYHKIAMATLADQVLKDYPKGLHALIVLDIDNFKGINDTLGHAFGDVVLIEVCTKLKTLFRSNDLVGRMGGDEFAVLMKNVPDTSNVLKKAAEISGAFRRTYVGEKEDYKISCSMGIIMIQTSQDSFEALYRKADAALYQAKQNGKDQFILYQAKDADRYPTVCARTNDEESQTLKASHNIEAHIFELLYTAQDFNVSINMALAAIGQQYHVSRVAIFENDEDNLMTDNIYEWCNDGIAGAMEQLQKVKLVSNGESILENFDANGLLYCNDVRELPPYFRSLLEAKKVLSNLQVIITNDQKVCGFIGFDECREYRAWTAEEIEKLSFLSKVLSVFLFKRKTEVKLVENLHTRLEILDILPDYICVVNPETHRLEYANQRMQQLLPMVRPGSFCFTTLRGGQNGPCETCLVERIKRGDTDNLEIVSEDQKTRLGVNVISINWTNDKKMVLLYGTEQSRRQ